VGEVVTDASGPTEDDLRRLALRYCDGEGEAPDLGPGEFTLKDWDAVLRRHGIVRSPETAKRRLAEYRDRGWLAKAERYDQRTKRRCGGYVMTDEAPDDFGEFIGEVLRERRGEGST
jgi:hypothetical protein